MSLVSSKEYSNTFQNAIKVHLHDLCNNFKKRYLAQMFSENNIILQKEKKKSF